MRAVLLTGLAAALATSGWFAISDPLGPGPSQPEVALSAAPAPERALPPAPEPAPSSGARTLRRPTPEELAAPWFTEPLALDPHLQQRIVGGAELLLCDEPLMNGLEITSGSAHYIVFSPGSPLRVDEQGAYSTITVGEVQVRAQAFLEAGYEGERLEVMFAAAQALELFEDQRFDG